MNTILDREEKAGLPFLSDKDRELFEDILANTISKKIRSRIHESNAWAERMNQLMGQMKTSSGLKLSLKWKSLRAEREDQPDTRDLVALLQKDAEIMREEEVEQLSRHFRSQIEEARRQAEQGDSPLSFHAVMAKYKGAREDAPRIISLDEAFAGVDETNIRDMFRLMVDFEFDFIINSQILWGDYETVPQLAIYQLVRPENAKFVSVIPYQWNGKERVLRADAE